MALQISQDTEHGFTASAAYVKITGFNGDKGNINIDVAIYFDSAARTGGATPIDFKQFVVATPTTDLLPALYAFLKTLPEFAGATDV